MRKKFLPGVMKIFRFFLVTGWVLLAVFVGTVSGGEPLSFSWAFFLKSGDEQVKSLNFATPEAVEGGNLLRIFLELDENAYVYLYLLDSRNDLYLVFPPSGSFYNGDFPTGYKAYIPSGQEWFVLDNSTGTERFYLLASPERLKKLEGLTDRFMVTGDSDLREQLLRQITEDIKNFSAASSYESDIIQVTHGRRLSVVKPPQTVDAHRISAIGGYGAILEMVNK
jgi:hypothetical protein